MALTGYLLDSNVVIDHLNGYAPASAFLTAHRLECLASPVTRAEVLAGAGGSARALATEILDLFPCLAIDAVAGDRAGDLRRDLRLKTADALQMALAELHDCRLVTRDRTDFKPVRFPRVLVPYR
jgi:predicted nucleic acid-binding protein